MIGNRGALLANASTPKTRRSRKLILDGVEYALASAQPEKFLNRHVSVRGSVLRVDTRRFDLSRFENVFVVGAGKASGRMAEYLERLLKDRVTAGFVTVLKGTRQSFTAERIVMKEASHPIPDQDGVSGASRILDLAQRAGSSDLVVSLFSGGGSALMPLPKDGLTLADKREVARQLILGGATIHEINAVRKHLSRIKGGYLAKAAHPATVISLLLSDVVGNDLNVIASGPTAPDTSTYRDAITVLKKYSIWDPTPANVRLILEKGAAGEAEETPKPGDPCFEKTYNFIVGSNSEICKELRRFYRRKGVRSLILTSTLEGEARDVGYFLSSILNEITASHNPMAAPCSVICGGEATVTVRGKGLGGRSQEAMLAALTKLQEKDGVAAASFGTDGLDGPTDAAGAVIDGFSRARSAEKSLDLRSFLADNDSYHFFARMGDLILTGATGTNVNDVAILIAV